MLCGLYPPSSGTAQIFGYDLRTQMDKIRCIMGYCPQVNILFDEFTVEEHLKLIAMVIRIILIILVKKTVCKSCFLSLRLKDFRN